MTKQNKFQNVGLCYTSYDYNKYSNLVSAVIFQAVKDYRKKVWQLGRYYFNHKNNIDKCKEPEVWTYNEMVAEVARLRRFFTEENIYWDFTGIDGKRLINEIDERMNVLRRIKHETN